MATLKDVAKRACVDVSTVSRALNNSGYVHPDTKARIYAAVKELSYRPNVLAQGLRQGKRHTIGVVVPRLNLTCFSDIVQAVERHARERGYATLVCSTEDDPKIEREALGRLRNGFVDGILIAGTSGDSRLLRDLHSSGLPVIQVVRRQEPRLSSVVADFEACGYEAVKYLVRRGCRHIGLINGDGGLAPYRERYLGYCRALKEFGLEEITVSVDKPVNTFEYGYFCTESLLDQAPALDAIMAAVDVQGIGALRALKDRGLRVPGDIRVLSLTGHAIGDMLETSLTALEIPSAEIGKKAVQMLIEEIEAPEDARPPAQHLSFAATLVEREIT